MFVVLTESLPIVPAGLPSHGGDAAVYVFDINQLSLPTPFHSESQRAHLHVMGMLWFMSLT